MNSRGQQGLQQYIGRMEGDCLMLRCYAVLCCAVLCVHGNDSDSRATGEEGCQKDGCISNVTVLGFLKRWKDKS